MNRFARRMAIVVGLALVVLMLATTAAWAGSPHFVGTPTYSISGNTITVHAKEAGLGDEAQIVAVLSGKAECINGGSNNPKAANKTSFSVSKLEPVQNGQATYTLQAT